LSLHQETTLCWPRNGFKRLITGHHGPTSHLIYARIRLPP